MKELMDIISNRKSVRKYSDKHISDDDLRKILEAGRLAPTGVNAQNTSFIILGSKQRELEELKEDLPEYFPENVSSYDCLSFIQYLKAFETYIEEGILPDFTISRIISKLLLHLIVPLMI